MIATGAVASIAGLAFVAQAPQVRSDGERVAAGPLRDDFMERANLMTNVGAPVLAIGTAAWVSGILVLRFAGRSGKTGERVAAIRLTSR